RVCAKNLAPRESGRLATHACEAAARPWAKSVQVGDLIVAADHYGGGSSREQPPTALKTLGVSAILANSFARIFSRNSINHGLPVLECPGLRRKVNAGDVIEVDMAKGEVHLPDGGVDRFNALPPNVLEILEAGGLVAKIRAERAPHRT